ncbi:unnamed protein product [Closterium sp. NIES-64]|nr:unnamed protein product [Closterium sp. NIES-64]
MAMRSHFFRNGHGNSNSCWSHNPSADSRPSTAGSDRASHHDAARRYERGSVGRSEGAPYEGRYGRGYGRGDVRGYAQSGSERPASPGSSPSPSPSSSASSSASPFASSSPPFADFAQSTARSPSSPATSTASPDSNAAAGGAASGEFPIQSHHTILDVDQIDPTAGDAAAWGGLDSAAVAAAWKRSFLKRVVDTITNSKYFNTAGWLIAGAATAAVGVQVTAHIIQVRWNAHAVQAIESVPLLASLEILVGAAVTTNVATTITGGGKARERLEQQWDEFVKRVSGTYGLSDPTFDEMESGKDLEAVARTGFPSNPVFDEMDGDNDPEPANSTGKETEGEELKDGEGKQATEADPEVPQRKADGEEGEEAVVAVRKAELVRVLSEFVERREGRARRVNRMLQQEVQAGRGLEGRLGDLTKALEVRTLASVAAAQNVARLQALNDSLQAERNSVTSQLSALTNQITGLTTSLDVLTKQQDSVSQSNTVLRTRLRKALLEKRQLAQSLRAAHRVQSERASDVEGRLRAVGAQLRASEGAMVQQRREEEVNLQTYLSQHAAIKSERNAAVVQARDLERRVASAEAQLKEVTRSRDHLFITNHELNTRLTAAMSENRLLKQRVDQLQRTSRHSAASFRDRESTLKQHLAERHAELAASRQQAAAELARVTSSLEAKVRAAQEEVEESKGAVRWLEEQVESMREEGLLHTTRLRAAVAAAEKRAQEEAERANELQALLAERKEASDRETRLLEEKVSSLESKLSETELKLAATVNSAIATAKSALLPPTPASPVDASLLSFEGFGSSIENTESNTLSGSPNSSEVGSSMSSGSVSSSSGGRRGWRKGEKIRSQKEESMDGSVEETGLAKRTSVEGTALGQEGSSEAGSLGEGRTANLTALGEGGSAEVAENKAGGGRGEEMEAGEASNEEVLGAGEESNEEALGAGEESSTKERAGGMRTSNSAAEAEAEAEAVAETSAVAVGAELAADGAVPIGAQGDGNGEEDVVAVDATSAATVRGEEEGADVIGADVEGSAAGPTAGATVGAEVSARGTPNEALGTPNENDLKVYARAIFPAYVSLDASIMEQSRGMTAMVQDMVKMGADKSWAKRHVEEELLKPALTQHVAVAAARAVSTRTQRKQGRQAKATNSNTNKSADEELNAGDLDGKVVMQ